MTTSTDMFLETVSLNDDTTPPTGGRVNTDMDLLEAQTQQQFPHAVTFTKNSAVSSPINDSDDDNDDANAASSSPQQVVVVVDGPSKLERPHHHHQSPPPSRPTLPPLRVPHNDSDAYVRDYVDPTLFSPEVSRRAVEIARGRAKTLEMELKELELLESESSGVSTPTPSKLSPAEAVAIISSAFATSLARVKQFVKTDKEYDLLSGSSPTSLARLDDVDTDSDGLQISPDSSQGAGQHFASGNKHRSALKRVSAYAPLDKDRKSAALSLGAVSNSSHSTTKKHIVWHDDVLDQDEEFVDESEAAGSIESELPVSPGSNETAALMDGAASSSPSVLHYKNDRLTPRSKKKRKKLVRSMMRRLTPSEKEELYRQRPDLMIVPNWAQKYRQGLEADESSRWSLWLVAIIATLAALLVVLIILIARERAAAAASQSIAH